MFKVNKNSIITSCFDFFINTSVITTSLHKGFLYQAICLELDVSAGLSLQLAACYKIVNLSREFLASLSLVKKVTPDLAFINPRIKHLTLKAADMAAATAVVTSFNTALGLSFATLAPIALGSLAVCELAKAMIGSLKPKKSSQPLSTDSFSIHEVVDSRHLVSSDNIRLNQWRDEEKNFLKPAEDDVWPIVSYTDSNGNKGSPQIPSTLVRGKKESDLVTYFQQDKEYSFKIEASAAQAVTAIFNKPPTEKVVTTKILMRLINPHLKSDQANLEKWKDSEGKPLIVANDDVWLLMECKEEDGKIEQRQIPSTLFNGKKEGDIVNCEYEKRKFSLAIKQGGDPIFNQGFESALEFSKAKRNSPFTLIYPQKLMTFPQKFDNQPVLTLSEQAVGYVYHTEEKKFILQNDLNSLIPSDVELSSPVQAKTLGKVDMFSCLDYVGFIVDISEEMLSQVKMFHDKNKFFIFIPINESENKLLLLGNQPKGALYEYVSSKDLTKEPVINIVNGTLQIRILFS